MQSSDHPWLQSSSQSTGMTVPTDLVHAKLVVHGAFSIVWRWHSGAPRGAWGANPRVQTEELLAVMVLRGSAGAGQDIEHCLQLAVLGTIDLDDVWKAHLVHHDLELVDSRAKELICLVVVKLVEACDPGTRHRSSVLAFFVADDEGQVGGLRLQCLEVITQSESNEESAGMGSLDSTQTSASTMDSARVSISISCRPPAAMLFSRVGAHPAVV